MSNLFEPITLGALTLPHRVAMAPLTRSRAQQPGNVPGGMNVEYYRQRASAALIITEATQISQQGQGYAWTPGIHSQEQIAGWREVSNAVHENGGRIFMQLWHVGRVSHPCFQPNGALPVAPTSMAVPGKTFILDDNGNGDWADVPTPQELDQQGINAILNDYAVATKNAMLAGMDGVEIHAGNGYLIDQFINSNSNKRTDEYGGSIENRTRFLFEVVEAVTQVIGSDRVSVRLTPNGRFMGMGDETPLETFTFIAEKLSQYNLAFLHLVEPEILGTIEDDSFDAELSEIIQPMRNHYRGNLMLAGGYTKEKADSAITQRKADIIAFGRGFIANPDFPERLKNNAPLNEARRDSFFGGNEEGYIDYPTLASAN